MFKVTGVSRCKGVFKVRFAGDMTRVKILSKTGHDEIELIEMPTLVDKAGCVNFLKSSDLYKRTEYKEAIDAADIKYNGDPTLAVTSKKSSKTTNTKAESTKPSLEAIKARASKLEKTENSTDTLTESAKTIAS